MKQKLKVIIQFDGHEFFGWQYQTQTSPTVQEVFNRALAKIYKQEVKTIGSGRTDTGVHALEHHVVFTPPFEIPKEGLVKALNTQLPDSIRAIRCDAVEGSFRPTNDAISKEYRYFFTNQEVGNPFICNYMSNISYSLDFALMQQACSLFEGEHDFTSFHCVGSDPGSTVRKIISCTIEKRESTLDGIIPVHYVIKVEGTGFLKQMVRLIVGAIWDVGRGKISLDELNKEIQKPTGKHLSPVAPAAGLFKFSVKYPS